MANLIRLTYVSKATFDCDVASGEIEPDVADILVQARKNNQKSKVSGALFFGEGYFFQCLEGRPSLILSLVEKIKTDSRHQNIKISYQRRVYRRYFSGWSMKYVPVTDNVYRLMKLRGYPEFDPINFDESDINEMFEMFTKVEDTSLINERLKEYSSIIKPWWRRVVDKVIPRIASSSEA